MNELVMASQTVDTHHVMIWHKDFWKLSLANLLLTIGVYMLLPVLPGWLCGTCRLGESQVAVVMGGFGFGVFLFGALCSWLIQKYRRNKVCILSILAVALGVASFSYAHDNLTMDIFRGRVFWIFSAIRFLTGAFFGLALMILNSTLIVDCCESKNRTQANFTSGWFSRFAIALGPMLGLLLLQKFGFVVAVYSAGGLCLCSALLLSSVSFPFKAPEDGMRMFSLDRFLMPNSLVLVLNTVLLAAVVGCVIGSGFGYRFYVFVMAGFFIALLLQKFFLLKYRPEIEAITGFILMLASLLLMPMSGEFVIEYICSVVIGIGVALVSTVFQICFIKVSDHCQRGTSQSTYLLSFELGVALGLASSCLPSFSSFASRNSLSLILCLSSFAYYVLISYRWYHRNQLKQ